MDVINLGEGSDLGVFLNGFKSHPRDNDSFQCSVIKGLYPLLNGLPLTGSVLEIGPGTNASIMNFFKSRGYSVSGVEYNKSLINRSVSDGVNVRVGNFLDMDGFGVQDLIYFWGSWSGGCGLNGNFTVNELNCARSLVNGRPDKELIMLKNDAVISKCYSLLREGGSLMFLDSEFARHGDGYGNNIECIINDYSALLGSLERAGFSSVCIAGVTKDSVVESWGKIAFSYAVDSCEIRAALKGDRALFKQCEGWASKGNSMDALDAFPLVKQSFNEFFDIKMAELSVIESFKNDAVVKPYLVVARK